jgi:hypothetical protein
MCLTGNILTPSKWTCSHDPLAVIGFKGSSFIAPVSVGLTFGLSILAFFETTIYSSPCLVYLSVWFSGELLVSN